ncbi:ABC transporter permease [Lachnotalea sp. AF33-28]|jgi:putative aldouronate transport system permease protein|uniref:ABC transporter permease n=1 Tax=Lachnotalea sp. AF33-28 TaxID=2292046 RepID=UPI000E4E74D7|nr:ABC transporter permease subunit [Lachnotalea sp. AF33-28]RHP36397.1 sugar ABC transporter permease [Lachnotalea sp. AF33-28]
MSRKEVFLKKCRKQWKKNWLLYLMSLPVMAYYICFSYIPMAGVQLAFKEFRIKDGIWGSPWVGFEHFERFFSSYNFKQLLANTLTISIYTLILGIVMPVIFALMLNYVRKERMKKTIQMLTYLPYFISTVVMVGMLEIFLGDRGMVNSVLGKLGAEPIGFLTTPSMFADVYAWSGTWQGLGFSSVMFVSALAGVDYELHEAAIVDGASKWRRIWHIDLVAIRSLIMLVLILNLGSVINVGYEKVLLMQNPLNMAASDVISTYVYRLGVLQQDYGYSTAVGLFNSLISVALILASNTIAKKTCNYSLW